jgi:DNA-binding NtrC family response regulator
MDQNIRYTSARKTVLVVDDDAHVRDLVAQLLTDSDFNVLAAGDGTTGLQQSRDFEGEIHLLLSDFEMPGMSGVDLARAMTLDRPQLEVLLMSGLADGMLILKEGWHFLSKPFMNSHLRALVLRLVSPERKSRFSEQRLVG